MRVSAKADYALRATIELAAADDGRVRGERIAQAQEIPLKFLENILGDLKHAGVVRSQRGAEGGYWLARPAEEITVADVVRAVDGPIAKVRASDRSRSNTPAQRSASGTSGSPSARTSGPCSSR
jgi:Rrf2 family protein